MKEWSVAVYFIEHSDIAERNGVIGIPCSHEGQLVSAGKPQHHPLERSILEFDLRLQQHDRGMIVMRDVKGIRTKFRIDVERTSVHCLLGNDLDIAQANLRAA